MASYAPPWFEFLKEKEVYSKQMAMTEAEGAPCGSYSVNSSVGGEGGEEGSGEEGVVLFFGKKGSGEEGVCRLESSLTFE